MGRQRRTFSSELKARVALAAIKGQMTVNQIAAQYEVHPNQVTVWKQQAVSQLAQVFSSGQARGAVDDEELKAQLYQQIGQLKVELDWLKKKAALVN